MFLIPTLQTEHLAKKLSRKNVHVVYPSLNKDGKRHFPDGELYVKIPRASRLAGQRVTVLHSGMPLPNEGLVELELILQILKDVKAGHVEVFFSYFPYGMQDSVFAKGETNVAEMLVEKLTHYYNVKKIFIVDAHFAGKEWTARYPLKLVSAVPLLMEAAKKDWGDELVFFSPDKGGKRRTTFQNIHKKRKNSYEVEMHSSRATAKKIKNHAIAVVDDLVETGGTLERFYEECKRIGAKEMLALITHGVLPEGISRVQAKYQKLYLTNTITRKEANVDITPLIVSAIR